MGLTRDNALTGTLIVCAIVIAAANVYRLMATPTQAAATIAPTEPTAVPIDSWDEFLQAGVFEGNVDAPVVIAYFADLECPFCRTFHELLDIVKMEYGDQVATLFLHYPLPIHRFAMPSALAAECAASG